MVDALPDPPVPPDTDVRDLDGFMLNVERLLASELVAIATPEECWAALMLWCRAWKQQPGGSLPNEDRILASFSGSGKRWPKVRDMALRGFVLCSDGRLYHRFLCAEVMRASAKSAAFRTRRDADRKRLSEWRDRQRETPIETPAETPTETRFVAEGTGTGTGTGTGRKKEEEDASHPKRARAPDPPDGFAEWYAEYPHKVGRAAAKTAYGHALARASPAELLDGIRRYVATKPSDRAWCNPATFLTQDRWLDEPATRINGHGHKLSPVDTLRVGAARAVQAILERERADGDRGAGDAAALPLLDRGR